MSKQKTAVEWLINEIDPNLLVTEKVRLAVQQAKQMEKEQIIDAFDKGLITENVYHGYDDKKAEHYYESKYGKDEEKAEI